MTKKHPYARHEHSAMWRALDKGIRALVKNGDIEENTARTHIVGYLTRVLEEAGATVHNGAAKNTRVIRINENEEIIVRSA